MSRHKQYAQNGGYERQHKQKRVAQWLKRASVLTGNPLPMMASAVLGKKGRLQKVKDYIIQRGEEPISEDNIPSLATQALGLRTQQVKERHEELLKDDPQATFNDAEASVLGEEEAGSYNGEPDNFIPAIAGAVFAAGKKGAQLIAANRAKKGKGVFWNKKGVKDVGNAAIQGAKTNRQPSDVEQVVEAFKQPIKEAETKDWIKKNLIYLIMGAIALGLIGYMIARRKK